MKHVNANYLKTFNPQNISWKYAYVCVCTTFEIYNSHQTEWGSHSAVNS